MTFEKIVFAGGGNRCFWQAGFWDAVSGEMPLEPNHIASVSAGSAISCAILAGKVYETLEITKEVMSTNPKNRYLENIFKSEPIYPHSKLYRDIILRALDEASLARIKRGPANHILLARIPKWLGPRSAVAIGIGAYQLEKHLLHPVHPRLGRMLGFRSEFIPAAECQDVNALADLILCSSCTPPFTPVMYHRQKPVLDGGMVDNVPVHGLDTFAGSTLVLLSRPYQKLPVIKDRLYVQPSRKVDVESWDYTRPDSIQKTFELGKQDGMAFLQRMNKSG